MTWSHLQLEREQKILAGLSLDKREALLRTQIKQIDPKEIFVIKDWRQRQWRTKFWDTITLQYRHPEQQRNIQR